MNAINTSVHYTPEDQLVDEVIITDSLYTNGFAEWDGLIEIGRCVEAGEDHSVIRIDDDDDQTDWKGVPFWTVYLHQQSGGVACLADFTTKESATAFAAGLSLCRKLLKR